MNNHAQQKFDRSIREAVEESRKAVSAKPRRDVTSPRTKREPALNGRLYLDPETGATIWEPTIAKAQS